MNYKIIFSPTGGVKKVADIISKAIGGDWEKIDICVPEKEMSKINLSENDVCILAVPSFGGRVAQTAVERMRKISANGAKAILLCVYGNRAYEDTLAELKEESEKSGFVSVAAVAAIAEHSIARNIAKGRPDEEDKKVLFEFGKTIKEKLEKNDYTLNHENLKKSGEYRARSAAVSIPETNENCVNCGMCEKICPVGAINENKQTDKEKCMACMKCVADCPKKARGVNTDVLSAISAKLESVCKQRLENELFI